MSYKVITIEDGNNKTYVVKNANNHPVSEMFSNKSQALKACTDFINGIRVEPVETAALPKAPDVTAPAEKANLTHRAVGMYKASDGCWTVAVIPFDPLTGKTGAIRTERAGNSKLEGDMKVKGVIAHEVLKSV